ncbi:DNA repair protein XRCC2 [Hyaena hyaena]|uniref:DNA repair protein XRCC2 n=1 Tax=Hyaena hyaena TaxID=95912 RepID=UPI00192375AC|nr:DNA repair protein XRCC2 [Hyaena hyaena]
MCSDFHRAESGTQLLARLEGRSSLKEIEPNLFADEDSSVHGDIIEFHGPEGTGKTEMFYHVTARCVLPKSEGGLEVEVLFIDTDYHFDLLRLVTILERRLSRGSEEAVRQCLARLFVVSCGTSSQLLLTLCSLETTVCSRPALCLLILDSLSAFYWTDRASGGESVSSQESALRTCSRFLERLAVEYRLVVLAATQSLMQTAWQGPAGGPGEPEAHYRPYLCREWQRLVKLRMFFSKQDDLKTDTQFSLVSRHLKSNSLKKHVFVIGESGIEFR